MSERERNHSPVSEGTLISGVCESGVNFRDNGSDDEVDSLEDINFSDDSSVSTDVIDNTDEDPDFDPNEPNNRKQRRFLFLNPGQSDFDASHNRPSTSSGQPIRPVPLGSSGVVLHVSETDQSSSDDYEPTIRNGLQNPSENSAKPRMGHRNRPGQGPRTRGGQRAVR
ncbi:hypothetical protein J6590_103427, partial [Homalodisca vitripennis]